MAIKTMKDVADEFINDIRKGMSEVELAAIKAELDAMDEESLKLPDIDEETYNKLVANLEDDRRNEVDG